jgi:hypothetical protein
MECPNCGAEMFKGSFEVKGTVSRFLFVTGWSWQSLWFSIDDPREADNGEGVLMDKGESPRHGWLCRGCFTSVIYGPKWVAPPPTGESSRRPEGLP